MSAKSSKQDRFVIIMAGGRGERFWPVSREKTPKQLITLLGGRSFLQQAVDRVLPVVPLENIYIITNAVQAPEVRRQLPKLPKENVVAEPVGRDTCAAVALGAAIVGAHSLTGVMAVLPADHVIPSAKQFQQVLNDAFDRAKQDPVIVTIGIPPTEPATGYGYIHVGETLTPVEGTKPSKTKLSKVLRFVEKPNEETAAAYLKSGDYLWNAGMFIWSVPTILAGLRVHCPELEEACQRWLKVAGTPRLDRVLAKEYPGIKKISVDFALLEKADNVVVADGGFAWDDLGAWTALARHLKPDAHGNCVVGDLVQVDSENNLVFDARTKNRSTITLVGITDSIIVQTDDSLLVAHKSQAQKIKNLVRQLTESKAHKKLV